MHTPTAHDDAAPTDRSLADRRQHARRPAVLPAKVLHVASRKYAVAETVDISDGGLLLRVEPSRPMTAGDEIEIGVAWQNMGLIPRSRMLRGKVVRVARAPGQAQAVAVQLAQTMPLALVA